MSGLADAGIGMLMTIHAAVRRDLDRIADALDAVAAGAAPADGARAVAAYWERFSGQLHHHHDIEDTEVWPEVRRTLGADAAAVLEAMVAEHAEVVERQDVVQDLIRRLAAAPDRATATAAGTELRRYADMLLAHLAHEEAEAVPLVVRGFSDEYWVAFMGRRQQDEGPDTFLPWVLDAAPEPAVAAVTGELPPPVRALLVEQWQPAHERLVAALPRTR